MSMDEVLVYSSYLVFLTSILLAYRFNKKVAVINFLVFLLYTSYLLYGLYYKSKGGTGLLWGASLLFFTGVHFLGIAIYLVLKWFKVPQKRLVYKKSLMASILSTVLILIGMLFRVSHWPFGKAILFIGIGLACLTLVFFVIQKVKEKQRREQQ